MKFNFLNMISKANFLISIIFIINILCVNYINIKQFLSKLFTNVSTTTTTNAIHSQCNSFSNKINISNTLSTNIYFSENLDKIKLSKFNNKNKKYVIKKRKTLGALSGQVGPGYGCSINSNLEIALLIENPNKKAAIINSINLFIHDVGASNIPFQIHIYQQEFGKPGSEITNNKILINEYKKKEWNKFDVTMDSLFIPYNGCFISIEWLNTENLNGSYNLPRETNKIGFGHCINMTNEFSKTMFFIREDRKDWYKPIFIQWNGFQLSNYNPSINIDVTY